MPNYYQIKQTLQFPEQTAVSKEQSKNALFDILQEEVSDNKAYCQELINKILKLPYAKLPDFFLHHCDFVEASIKWLNKFEKLISENEEMFVSRTMRDRMMKYYTIIERKRKELEIIHNRHPRRKPPMQYINAECEERYFSFKEVKSKVKGMALHRKNNVLDQRNVRLPTSKHRFYQSQITRLFRPVSKRNRPDTAFNPFNR